MNSRAQQTSASEDEYGDPIHKSAIDDDGTKRDKYPKPELDDDGQVRKSIVMRKRRVRVRMISDVIFSNP